MAQGNPPVQTLRQRVQALHDELLGDIAPSQKNLQAYLRSKDNLIGGGQHHRERHVTRGQILGDLRGWLDDSNH
jgi:hypothetical protein